MLRRLVTLSVLLLSLSGVMPTAFACAPSVQGPCCPADLPRDSTGGSVPQAHNDGPCCIVDVGSSSIAAATLETERRVADVPSPEQPSAFPTNAIAPVEFVAGRAEPFQQVSPPELDQRQVYLLTGRLRL